MRGLLWKAHPCSYSGVMDNRALEAVEGLLNYTHTHTQIHTSSSVNRTPEDPTDPRLIPQPALDVASLHVPTVCNVGEGRRSLFI